MIQFNLLPDVKVEYIKTRRRKRLIILVSTVSSLASFSLFVLLFLFVRVSQTAHIKNLDKDISSNISKIQSVQDIDKILTIQNQLNTLPGLHDKKIVASRLSEYLAQVTPQQATLSNVNVDFVAGTMSVRGEAENIAVVNKFADTLKFTDFKVNDSGAASGKAFNNVVLESFSIGTSTDAKASYSLNFNYDPAIFAVVKETTPGADKAVTLSVPKIISTRSETERPTNLFSPQSNNQQGQGQ